MDNARLDLGDGAKKLQGAALRDVVAKWEPAADASALRFVSRSGDATTIPLADVLADGDLRIWTSTRTRGSPSRSPPRRHGPRPGVVAIVVE